MSPRGDDHTHVETQPRQPIRRIWKSCLDFAMNTLRRRCSTSPRVCGFISNIGKQPIPIPSNVTLAPSSTSLTVKGPLGETTVPLEPYMKLSFPQQDVLSLAVEDGAVKHQRAMWGTIRSLINNAVIGMTNGFSKPLYLVGVGYRAALEDDPRGTLAGGNGKRLNLKLGHSHNIFVPIPAHITAEVPSATKIVLSSTNNVALGHFAAKIRRLRPPEPYKGKGVFIGDETIRLRAIKKK
ncbi:ribosomal protein L6, alpha-beta domain-containing protein [Boletus reticuloceps]|uniref:Ribosomal protein L6, alpha-beta domain-containing protein n=1 Tax=Boletus reticuloceps TaxID=495285 RepID=A0A8I2YTZ3_9AGAM|nr:ribosomal protein L6, alpha-beta domain-containing protein [Boletus reticuloceps]